MFLHPPQITLASPTDFSRVPVGIMGEKWSERGKLRRRSTSGAFRGSSKRSAVIAIYFAGNAHLDLSCPSLHTAPRSFHLLPQTTNFNMVGVRVPNGHAAQPEVDHIELLKKQQQALPNGTSKDDACYPLPTHERNGKDFPVDADAAAIASQWLKDFEQAANKAANGDGQAVAQTLIGDGESLETTHRLTFQILTMFHDSAGWWRDKAAFTWDYRTLHGSDKIAQVASVSRFVTSYVSGQLCTDCLLLSRPPSPIPHLIPSKLFPIQHLKSPVHTMTWPSSRCTSSSRPKSVYARLLRTSCAPHPATRHGPSIQSSKVS